MNPLTWKREHQIALGLAVGVGITVGVIVGYMVYAAGSGAGGASSFGYWFESSFRLKYRSFGFRRPGIWWGLTGGLIGAALIYIRLLSRKDEPRQ